MKIFPLNPAQHWLLNYFPPPYEWYDQMFFPLNLPISIKAIQTAIAHLVERHDGLRTHFVKKNGQWLQQIYQSLPKEQALPLLYHTEERSERDYQRMKQELALSACQEFNLLSGPLFKVLLFKRSNKHCEVLFLFHHIIADYIACITLLKEFNTLYSAFLTGKEATLPSTKSNAEYMQSLSKAVRESNLPKMIDFWQKDKHFSIYPFIQRKVPGKERFSKRIQKIFPRELSEKLLRYSKKHFHARSLHHILVAPLYQTLQKEMRQNQITISQKLHGRSLSSGDPRFIGTVGNFAINVPVTCETPLNESRLEMISEVEKRFSELPLDGLSYDILHLTNYDFPYPDHHITPIRFNYMGISPYQKMIQRVKHPEQYLSTYIECFVYFYNHSLHVEVQYDQSSIKSDFINRIIKDYFENLKNLSLEF